jgi:phage shock protein A
MLTDRFEVNRSQIDGWLWRARHAIRKGNAKLACEAMLTALWLMGAE